MLTLLVSEMRSILNLPHSKPSLNSGNLSYVDLLINNFGDTLIVVQLPTIKSTTTEAIININIFFILFLCIEL